MVHTFLHSIVSDKITKASLIPNNSKFLQQLIRANKIKTSNPRITGPLWGESIGDH